MPEFFIDCSIGGTIRIKVQAENIDDARAAAADRTIDDWNEGGRLKLADVTTESVVDDDDHHPLEFEQSIIANPNSNGGSLYELAPDDPSYDEDDDEGGIAQFQAEDR